MSFPIDFGTVRPGTTLYIPFHTFDSNDPSASVTITGLATTDIEIYKDGSTTQRASDAGYALLDTDGIDFDSTTGIHGFSIDLSDNTTANFYEAGSQYWVVVASITVDAATVNFLAATFRIGYPDAILNTTIATLASQTSFTLEEGPADNDALNGFRVIIHDLASDVQLAHGIVSDYVGSTRTVTLKADPGIFTMAAGDNASFFAPALVSTTAGNTLDVNATGEAGLDLDNTSGTIAAAQIATDAITADKIAANAITSSELADGAITAAKIATDAITSAKIAADAIGASEIAADAIGSSELATTAVNEIRDAILSDSTAFAGANIAAIVADTNELQGDWANGGRLDLILDARASQASVDTIDGIVDAILVDTGATIPGLIAALNDLSAAQVNAEVVDALATDTYAEPTGVPGATITLAAKIGYLYMMARNRVTVTSTKKTYYDDGNTAEFEKDLSDDGTTYDESEVNAV